MNNIDANYKRILEILRKISKEQQLSYQRRKPKTRDLELISLTLTAEFLGIDRENDLFRKLLKSISIKIERSVYNNRRKRNLSNHMQVIRLKLASYFNEFEYYFIVDSMPLEICKLSRSSRSKICKESNYSFPDKGYCASQGSRNYRYKLHAVCSVNGVFQSFDLSTASVYNIHNLKDIQAQIKDCTLIADKGYLSSEIKLNLFKTCKINLNTHIINNQKKYKKKLMFLEKKRKRIETLFSQLFDPFMIRRNYAKSFEGFKTRILSKITALNVMQFINKVIFNRNINNIKISII